MSFTFIAQVGNYAQASGTSLSASAALNIAAHDVLIAACGWYGDDQTVTVDQDDASNPFTELASTHTADGNTCFAYLLDAAADAAATVRFVLGAQEEYRSLVVMQFRPDSGETVTLDAGPSGNSGNSDNPTSSTINTSGTDEVIAGMVSCMSGAHSSPQIAGLAADASYEEGGLNDNATWYKLFTSDPGDGIDADCTLSASAGWVCDIIAIKSEAGAAGAMAIPLATAYYNRIRSVSGD